MKYVSLLIVLKYIMNCCPCGNDENAVVPPIEGQNVERRYRFPREAHHRPLHPVHHREEDVYRGFEEDLEVVYNQFADDFIDFPGIRGVRTKRDLVVGNLAVRYEGEKINSIEVERRILRSEGGMVVDAGYNEEGERVYIDGAVGGNIACLINHHCNPSRVNVELRKVDNYGEPEVHFMVIKPIPAGTDLYFDNRGSVACLPLNSGDVVRTVQCLCKGFESIERIPICARRML